MIRTDQFASRIEVELRATRAVSEDACQLWSTLDEQGRAAFSRAITFIVGDGCGGAAPPSGTTRSEDRMMASRLMLLKLRLDTTDPRWSSEILSRYVHSALATPGASLNDVLNPLSKLIGESDVELSAPLAQFLKDVVVLSFTQFRKEYEAIDWNSFIESLGARPTQAQCYLSLYAIPAEILTFTTAEMIVERLGHTRYHDEVTNALAVSR